ncbi:Uncharacterised protein [Burkholderia pseudomallei]|nr:Uncharacterised protein [Burkholderia pseudomallei]CAK1333304.1 Uncharacterised protein [Burkholderia pseudomallei]CFL59368.1 Uncharacterised protein [Burkholderia pseudomallei]CFL76398.1 Uncharacterised protein [Burkholderia pseudomallei]CPG06197.1 Uncharacterised protein [Burkholderia pseudomallei]
MQWQADISERRAACVLEGFTALHSAVDFLPAFDLVDELVCDPFRSDFLGMSGSHQQKHPSRQLLPQEDSIWWAPGRYKAKRFLRLLPVEDGAECLGHIVSNGVGSRLSSFQMRAKSLEEVPGLIFVARARQRHLLFRRRLTFAPLPQPE